MSPKQKNSACHPLAEAALKNGPIHLDVGSGANPHPGFLGIDGQAFPGVIQHNLLDIPWPLPDGCASIAIASHVVEHISRENNGVFKFFNELWRVLRVEAQVAIAGPYGLSSLFVQDPTHVNPINENTWRYFDPCDPSGFYGFYRPKPWKIVGCTFSADGFLEAVLEKRREDPSYKGDASHAS